MSSDQSIIRELLRQENDVMNHRMSWFLTLQGFLFAALAFGWKEGSALIVVFGIVGVMSSISVGILLRHAVLAMKHLQDIGDSSKDDPIIGRSHKENPAIIHFLLPWHFLPILFALAWLSIIVMKLMDIA